MKKAGNWPGQLATHIRVAFFRTLKPAKSNLLPNKQTPLLRSRPLLTRIVFANTRRAHSAPRPEISISALDTDTGTGRSTNSGYLLFEASDSLIARVRVRLGAGAASHHPVAFFLRASGSGHRPYGRFHDGWWGGLDESYEPCQLPPRPWPWEQQWHQQAQEEQHGWH